MDADDSPAGLITQMENCKDEVIQDIGEDRFDEEMQILKTSVERAEAAGAFESISGDVD